MGFPFSVSFLRPIFNIFLSHFNVFTLLFIFYFSSSFSLSLSPVSSSDDLPSAVRVDPPGDAHPPPILFPTSPFVGSSVPFVSFLPLEMSRGFSLCWSLAAVVGHRVSRRVHVQWKETKNTKQTKSEMAKVENKNKEREKKKKRHPDVWRDHKSPLLFFDRSSTANLFSFTKKIETAIEMFSNNPRKNFG